MHHSHKLKALSLLKWGSFNFLRSHLKSPETQVSLSLVGVHRMVKTPTFYSTSAKKDQILKERGKKGSRVSQAEKRAHSAQSALLEYLHGTRNYPFPDAEHISKNCPAYINKLLEKVEGEDEVVPSLAKHFQYHPINEFEPFLESLGLASLEIDLLLPRDLLFLKDDALLLENYHVLSNYGVSRGLIGKFYKSAFEVFKYDKGVLRSKLRCYEDMGLSESSVIKFVVSSPSLLVGTVNEDIVRIVDLLKSAGVELTLIERCLSVRRLYDWSRVLDLLSFVCRRVALEKNWGN